METGHYNLHSLTNFFHFAVGPILGGPTQTCRLKRVHMTPENSNQLVIQRIPNISHTNFNLYTSYYTLGTREIKIFLKITNITYRATPFWNFDRTHKARFWFIFRAFYANQPSGGKFKFYQYLSINFYCNIRTRHGHFFCDLSMTCLFNEIPD